MTEQLGKKTWIFADGDLPPAGDVTREPVAHEALMVLNLTDKKANLEIDLIFDNRDPVKGIKYTLGSQRVNSIRMDKPIGAENFQIPFGQYAIVLHSDVPVVAVFGRLDTRENVSYYPIQGYSV